jgi:hypothetical protein
MAENQEEEWEYYDDSTTLTDLWQILKESNLENDPLDVWLKSPTKNLTDVIHDYWRLKVPLKYAPTFGYTSVDNAFNHDDIKTALIDPLEAFICGSHDTHSVFEVIYRVIRQYFPSNCMGRCANLPRTFFFSRIFF